MAEAETLELLSVHKENHPHSSNMTGRLVRKGIITVSRDVNEGEATGVVRVGFRAVGDITLLLCHIVWKSEATIKSAAITKFKELLFKNEQCLFSVIQSLRTC